MTKTTLTILLLILTLITTSCKNELETIVEPDYEVVRINYEFDNYIKSRGENAKPFIIRQRNLILIDVDKNGLTTIEDTIIQDSLISSELIKYIKPNPENVKMPMTIDKEFEYAGKVTMNKHSLILASFSKELSYEKYQDIRNQIYVSFNLVRSEFSMAKYGKTMSELMISTEEVDKIKWNEIMEIFPIRYTETM